MADMNRRDCILLIDLDMATNLLDTDII